MANLAKYEPAVDRYNSFIASGMTVTEALDEMKNNVLLYQILPDVDSPQDRRLMNIQLQNILWYANNVGYGLEVTHLRAEVDAVKGNSVEMALVLGGY